MFLTRFPRDWQFYSFRIFLSLLVVVCSGWSVIAESDSAHIVDELDSVLPEVIASGNSPSIQVAAIYQGEIIWSQAFGDNTSIDHVYMNASVQKSFTAAAVLQLVERGLVNLDADIGQYVPFAVRHPAFPSAPITVRMLLSHRSGLDYLPYIFEWDTESTFSPQYRRSAPAFVLAMSHEEFLRESLTPGGSNYDPQSWIREPGRDYYYSVSAYPLLRYLVSKVAGQSYADYVRDNIFSPLGMMNSGFSAEEFAERHAIPYTRMSEGNVELPIWDGNGSMMHTTAQDMARFMLALMQKGQLEGFQLLQPETVELMQRTTSRFKILFKGSEDLPSKGYCLGLFAFRGGWFGYGGSAPGFQCLMRYNPTKQVGFVILSNVNAILSGGDNYASARAEVYDVQDALISILDPSFSIRRWGLEIAVIGGCVLVSLMVGLRLLLRK